MPITALPSTHRLFFALWPDVALAEKLDALASTLDPGPHARRIERSALHITLAFLGAVEADRIAPLIELANRLPRLQCAFPLDRIGSFKRSGIVWAGSHLVCAELSGFIDALHTGLRQQGFELESRPFVPHVTLFRRGFIKGAHPIEPALQWEAQGMRLVETVPDVGYRPIWRND